MLQFVVFSSVGLFLYSLVRYSVFTIWFLELTVHFGEYALLASVLSLGLTLCYSKKFKLRDYVILLVLNCLTLYLQSYPLIHFFEKPAEVTNESNRRYSIIYANVNAASPPSSEFNSLIKEYDPDFVALVEFTNEWAVGLPQLNEYPYKKISYELGTYGMALFSRFEFVEKYKEGLGFDLVPTMHLEFPELGLDFSQVHLMPPISKFAYWHDRALARRLATQYRHSKRASLVVGDFNATPYSVIYGVMVDGALMSNAFSGFDIPRTWSENHFLFSLAIDHIFYKGPLTVTSSKILPAFGSDHLPLFVEFELG